MAQVIFLPVVQTGSETTNQVVTQAQPSLMHESPSYISALKVAWTTPWKVTETPHHITVAKSSSLFLGNLARNSSPIAVWLMLDLFHHFRLAPCLP